jgi:hypothetical protein
MSKGNQQRLYSVEQASEYLGGVSPHSLRKRIQSGDIIVTRLGKRTMLPQAELDRIVREGLPLRQAKTSEKVV